MPICRPLRPARVAFPLIAAAVAAGIAVLAAPTAALAQDDIDNLFGPAAGSVKPGPPDDQPPELGQDDVDRMFG